MMKQLLRQSLSSLSYQAMRFTNGTDTGLRILMYHRVTDAHPHERLCVPVKAFAEQMSYLDDEDYHTVTISQVADWLAGRAELPTRAIAITFDDGYEDNFLYAYPELARYGFRACFFVPSGFIESGATASYAAADRPMTWGQLHELVRDHQEIGAHSVTHRKLTRLRTEEMRWEVQHCKEVLEQGLGHAMMLFCYPAGDYDASVWEAVQRTGYRAACTVKPGANHPGTDPLALRRTEISAFDSLWDFEKKLAGAYDWLHASVQAVQRAQHIVWGRGRETGGMGPS